MKKVSLAVSMFLLLAVAASASGQAPFAERHVDEALALLREMAKADDPEAWLDASQARLTRNVARAADYVTEQGISFENWGLALAASQLAAMAHILNEEPGPSLESWRSHYEVRFMVAETADEYAEVRREVLRMLELSASSDRSDLELGFAALAAESSFFRRTTVDPAERDAALLSALEDLALALTLAGYSTNRSLTERLVSLTSAVVAESTAQFFLEQERFDDLLTRLAGLIDEQIPVDFEFTLAQVGDDVKTVVAARELAALSFRYGLPAAASARLAVAEQRARAMGDPELAIQIISERHRGEESAGNSTVRLRRLREKALASAPAIRSRYRSRAGRLWAAYRFDRLFGEMLKGQLADATPDRFSRVFETAEMLKARALLDALSLPRPDTVIDTKESRKLKRVLLGFERPRLEGDLLIDEMRLVSQLSGFATLSGRLESRVAALRRLEALYAEAGAGFDRSASPLALADLQQRLAPGEALLQYVIPYHLLHPASDLWMTLVTRSEVRSAHVSLDEALGIAGLTGRLSVDEEAPLDTSALGEQVALLRTEVRTSNDGAAAARLRLLDEMLLQPLRAQGVRFEEFDRLVVVPHGALHYVPFPALIDPEGEYFIEKVALTVAPSASVWSVLSTRSSDTDRFVAFANPSLKGRGLPKLHFAEQEVRSLERLAPATSVEAFAAEDATRARFLGEAPGASLLHVSTHGEFPDENALDLHGLWLGDETGEGKALRAIDVRRMDLSAVRLAVLNVCNGGLYRFGPSDEPYGLMPAFLEAGAHNVLSTLWPMEDRFARDFMAEFYTHLGEGPAKAHQRTMLRFLREDEYIRRWAGYVLSGSGRFATD